MFRKLVSGVNGRQWFDHQPWILVGFWSNHGFFNHCSPMISIKNFCISKSNLKKKTIEKA
jgi:hypothetical protein